MNNLLCVMILKILIFLRFFPGSLFLKNFQLLGVLFLKLIPRWQNPQFTDLTLKCQQRPKSIINLLTVKKKNSTYLILSYILLTSTIREVRRNSKENLSSEIGTSRIKVAVLCCVNEDVSCSFLATDSQRDALADKSQAYLFP